jgi:hypothetical protein
VTSVRCVFFHSKQHYQKYAAQRKDSINVRFHLVGRKRFAEVSQTFTLVASNTTTRVSHLEVSTRHNALSANQGTVMVLSSFSRSDNFKKNSVHQSIASIENVAPPTQFAPNFWQRLNSSAL